MDCERESEGALFFCFLEKRKGKERKGKETGV